MAYTKYSLTPSSNTAAPPDGAPEGMLPSAVNDTMRDMMAQIRDCGDGIRGGTYTMTAPVITGGSINGAAIGATTASTGRFSTLEYTGTLTGGTGVVNLGSGQFYKDASGNIGVGTSSPVGNGTTIFHINGTVPELHLTATSLGSGVNDGFSLAMSSDSNAYLYNKETGAFVFGTSNAERMRIDSSGNLLLGTTTSGASGGLTIASGKFIYSLGTYANTTGTAANMVVAVDGSFARSTSSLKYKTDVQDAVHGLDKVLKLRSVTFKGINDGDTVFGGLIAEEVHEAGLTEFVQYAEDGSPDALSYQHMVSLAFKAIQEQQALIQNLTTRLTALEGK